ncbi:MAG: hypothetical protein JWP97_4670 [Labilithrix sp.]|nr:hypothetical protein [Labilithrix sp.]
MPLAVPHARRSRARRVLGVIGAVVGTTVTFVAATAAAAVVHLDTPATRRVVASQVNGILGKQFAGDIKIEDIGGLGLRGIDGVRVRIKDPTGMQVLYVDGATVHLRTLQAARSFLFGKGDILVPVDLVSLGHVDAAIDGDPAGNLRIANAFAARTPTPPTPADPNARGVAVEAPSIALTSAWVHGQAPGAPPVDAELHALAAKAHYDGKLIKADLDRVDLVTRGLPRGVDPRGRIGAKLSMPSATGKDMGVEGAFDGVIAGVPTQAHGGMDGQKIDAVVDGRDPNGEGVRSTFGELVVDEVTLHAEAHGELPKIDAKAHVAVGKGTVDVDSHVDISDGTKADAQVQIRHIDLHGIMASLPASDVGLDTTAHVAIAKSGAMSGNAVVATQPGTVAGQALPVLNAKGEFTDATAHVTGRLDDPRARAQFNVDMHTVGTDKIVVGQVHSDIDDLSRLPVVGQDMKGRAKVDADGTVNLGTKVLSAKTKLVADKVAYQTQTVDNLNVLATATGSMDRPVVQVGVHAGGIVAGGQKIGVADVRGTVDAGDTIVVRDGQIDIVRGGRNVGVHADSVSIGGPSLAVRGAVITGLGEPLRADVQKNGNDIHLVVDGPSLDLVRVAQLAGQNGVVRSGTIGIKGDVRLRGTGASGDLHLQVDNLSAGQINGARAKLDTKLDGRTVDLDLVAELAEAGRVELATTRLEIGPGSPTDPRTWQRAHGRARFAATLDLAKLTSFVPADTLPVSELAGQLVVAGSVRRDSDKVPPEATIHVHTRGLTAAGVSVREPDHDPTHGEKVTGIQPWRIEGVDASFDTLVDATSGLGEVAFHAVDAHGTLVGFDAKSILPYEEMVAHPDRAVALLEKTPVNARFVIPKRPLAQLPDIAGMKSMPGTIEAEMSFSGTALEPKLTMWAHAREVRSPSLSAKLAADADVDVTYDGQKADLAAVVKTGKKEALTANAHFDVKVKDLLEPQPGKPLDWGGSANVALASFPLQSVAPLADRRVRGNVSGTIAITDLHKDAKLDTNIAFQDLKIGQAQYKSGKITVVTGDNKVTATARLDQTDGFVDLRASTGLAWGAQLVPTPDGSSPTEAHLEAKGFRAAAIRPFVGGAVNELDGRIDANATVKLAPGFKDPTLEGNVDFHDGNLQLAAFGEEYKDVTAKVSFLPGGVIKLDDLSLRGTEGVLTGSANAKMRGLGLDTAQAQIEIPKRRPLDLNIGGTGLGAISGKVAINAVGSVDGKNIKIAVEVPTADLTLPQKLKSGVQELSSNEAVRVGVFRTEKNFVKLPLSKADLEPVAPVEATASPVTLDVDVKLGEITVVSGNMARIVLGGQPHIHIADKTEISGRIELKQGKVDVQGKSFTIEKGTITFQPEDTSNPIVVATAEWVADDGSHIYADFVGPVKTGKVTLRSDPPRPRNEVLAMILFGTADGANAPPAQGAPNGTTKAAVGVGGGFAAQGLTEALDDLTGIQAQAKIDTSRSANPAPEIEIQLARKLSIAFEHVLGTPPITEPDVNLATVEWRFRANWSLQTTVGDAGKLQSDAIWTKRY